MGEHTADPVCMCACVCLCVCLCVFVCVVVCLLGGIMIASHLVSLRYCACYRRPCIVNSLLFASNNVQAKVMEDYEKSWKVFTTAKFKENMDQIALDINEAITNLKVVLDESR